MRRLGRENEQKCGSDEKLFWLAFLLLRTCDSGISKKFLKTLRFYKKRSKLSITVIKTQKDGVRSILNVTYY